MERSPAVAPTLPPCYLRSHFPAAIVINGTVNARMKRDRRSGGLAAGNPGASPRRAGGHRYAEAHLPEALTPRLRRYLYVTAALTGAAIMVVEILGAKMLAPYVGMSHFVWTAQIATTLVALALGYYVGGWVVDRSPRLGALYGGILAAAVYLCLTVLVVEPVAYWGLRFDLAVGSLLASLFLFFPPLALLAMVGPFFVRILTESVTDVGSNMGRLTAVGTLGSFAGTILIGYVLIPLLPNSTSMYLTAATLAAVGIGYFVAYQRQAVPTLVVLVGAALALGFVGVRKRPQFARSVELDHANSNFGLLQVLDDAGTHSRYFMDDFLMQNSYDPVAKQSLSAFTDVLHALARGYTPDIHRVLCIGLGIGTVPMQFAREGASVDVVEINRAVVPLAEKYFDLDPQQLHIVIGGGRYFVNKSTDQYDTIIVDAFVGDSSPSNLLTREAFEGMRRLLKPGGTLVINSIANFEPGREFLVASLEKTLKAVFRNVRVHRNRSEVGVLNAFFVASDQPELVMAESKEWEHVHPSVQGAVRATLDGVVSANPNAGVVLRDRYNPIEYYDAVNREELRRRMAYLVRLL